jgi:antitoxin VapB
MGILIKNPETERKARELAALRGETLTGAIDQALEKALEAERAKPKRKYTLAEKLAATEVFRKSLGIDPKTWKPVTKAEWDALWPTGIPEIDNS